MAALRREREILGPIEARRDIDKAFLRALGLSTSFRNEEAAKILWPRSIRSS
jgi:hypothetical protein